MHQLVGSGAADAQLRHDAVGGPVKRAVTIGNLIDHGNSSLIVGISPSLELTVVSLGFLWRGMAAGKFGYQV